MFYKTTEFCSPTLSTGKNILAILCFIPDFANIDIHTQTQANANVQTWLMTYRIVNQTEES